MTTPENISTLKENQIFVFGSNLNGSHSGGAALKAKEFGAQDGIGEGLTGQTYAFPTLDKRMSKVSKKALVASKEKLYQCAKENPNKQFLVTKVGCGIAGFSEEDMKSFFKGEKPSNVILPPGWSVIRGYKAFNDDMTCRGMQYELGKEYRHDGAIKICSEGFHFCKSLGDCYSYYSFGSIICEVESDGDVIDGEGNGADKSVTNHLRITRMLNPEEAKGNRNTTSTGYLNTGDLNTGNRNTGDLNTGNRNTGDWNTGDLNTGNRNTGDWNTGDRNTGDLNTGNWNTGDWNTGNRNTGDRNTGNWNTGDWNTGDRNTGNWNTGDWNTGDLNTGNRNTGDWNTGDLNTGYFNTETPDEVLVFNKKCSRIKWENARKPSCLYFNLTEWIPFKNMTETEKEKFPTCTTTGGYLKKYSYKEAFAKSMEKATVEDIEAIKKLPNFNAKVFEEISGVKI